MISIIICSRTPEIKTVLSQNIEKTIGCDYELIVIDNSRKKYSIFEAYNLGVQKSKGEYWCFVHDDILFHTQDWGIETNKIFESDSKIGLIGVAGAKIKTKMPSAWWDCPKDQQVINIIQHLGDGKIERWELGWNKKQHEEVVAIDGVFMVGRRNSKIQFDEKKLKGFHNYDLNFSLEYIQKGYKIIVTRNVLLEHFSLGIVNESWLNSTLEFDRYYSKFLPLYLVNNKKTIKNLEFNNGFQFCTLLLANGLTKVALSYWMKIIILKPSFKKHKPIYFILKKRVLTKIKKLLIS